LASFALMTDEKEGGRERRRRMMSMGQNPSERGRSAVLEREKLGKRNLQVQKGGPKGGGCVNTQ